MSNAVVETLVSLAGLSRQDVETAMTESRKQKTSILLELEKLQKAEEKVLLKAYSKAIKVPSVNIDELDIPKTIIKLIPGDLARELRVVPIDRAGNNIIVAMSDPQNLQKIDSIRFRAGYFAKPVLALDSKISEALNKYYGTSTEFEGLKDVNTAARKSVKQERRDIQSEVASKDSDSSPIIQLVNKVLIKCLTSGASDIHFEAYEEFMRVRLRIDGSLQEIARPPKSMKAPLVSRIKIMAGLNIAESRLPQDGAINIMIGDKPVDFRVNTLPTVYGEKIVMRILDKSNLQVDMTQLGFEQDQMDNFVESITRPHGMVLVTGPTGSGKTTTLYSALSTLNQVDSNVMTAEDPVEYNLDGINQVQTKAEIGLNFASALRAFLRQDPDIIMVGEIRDLETGEIAMKAALTGHLVLSTLHTNSATDTVSRLLNMGIEAFNLVAALNCITAQRLMKKICERCRIENPENNVKALVDLGLNSEYAKTAKTYIGQGCSYCGRAGTKGRVAVHEVLKSNDSLKQGILDGVSTMELKKIAMANGMKSLRQSGLNKMIQGQVTPMEVAKTTSPDRSKSNKGRAA